MITWGRRLHDVGGSSLEEKLAKVAGAGFRSIQLAPTKSLDFAGQMLTPGFGRYLSRCLKNAGLEVAILGSYFDLSAGGEEAKIELEKYFQHLQLAKWAGFEVVATETGRIPHDHPQYEERFQNVLQNTARILERTEALGLTFAIEPVYGHTICDANTMESVIQYFSSGSLRVLYDPVNLLDPNHEERAETMWQDFIKRLGHLFVAVHVKDYIIEDGQKVDRAAGFGKMNHEHLFHLAQDKPHLDFLIESAKDEQIESIKEKFGI